MTTSHRPGQGISRGLVFLLALITAMGVANLYYNQPMLGVIGRSFPEGSSCHLIPTLTLFGYAAGLLFLVPLGDLLQRRTLIMAQFLAMALALALAALAPNGQVLLIVSFFIGGAASVVQQIVPLGAALATDERRGAVVGSIMGGLFCGVLLSRTLAGFVATHLGWRAMFWIGVPLAILGALSTRILPVLPPTASMGYGALLSSMGRIWKDEPRLRHATFTQTCLFMVFNAFWTILALHLEQPPLLRGAATAGLFGVVGTIGILAAPLAGRQADKRGFRPVVMLGVSSALVAWLILANWISLTGLVVGVILLDFGAQSSLIAHQQLIYSLRPEAKNRVNTIFMVGMFLGGSLGAALAMAAWHTAGWRGVSTLSILLCVGALAFWKTFPREKVA
ncbi:MAG: hypothetical protein H6Q00_724 [Holophagaceae bacterium]|nr:hypothetical protein [Holophagaceae bacterium]